MSIVVFIMNAIALPIFLWSILMAPASQPASAPSAGDAREFESLIAPGATLEKLATGLRFVEGPAWIKDDRVKGGGYVVFSDIPADEMKKWSEADGLQTFRKPSNNANGNTLDREGNLVTCEPGARCVSTTGADGQRRVLVERTGDGKRLNAPNDVVVKSDGTIWFTDPPYGVKKEDRELDKQCVYRFDPRDKKLSIVTDRMSMPNGLCFSPDERVLYVGESDDKGPRNILAFEVSPDDAGVTDPAGRIFAAIDQSKKKGVPDGMRIDAEGRLWSTAGDGIQIFSREGQHLGTIAVPETPANLCWGGEDGKSLFITASKSLYRIRTTATNAARPQNPR